MPYDGLGRKYDVGDNIVYALSSRSSGEMVIGRVEAIEFTNAKGESLTRYDGQSGPRAPIFRVKVQPLSFPTQGGRWRRQRYVPEDQREPGAPAFQKVTPKPVILSRISNVLRWDGAAWEEQV